MISENTNNTPNIYPVEQPFKFPLIITAILILIPALVIYWFFGDSTSFPRSLKLFFGNWISPIILWFFTASFLHLILKKRKLKKEQQHSQLISEKLLPQLIEDNETEGSTPLITKINNAISQNNINRNNLIISRLSLFLNHKDDNVDEIFAIKEKEYLKGSYSLSRFMVWAIPIMGFIGTVWGISNGIAHFSDAMTTSSSVTDVSAMLKENLPLVTNSLATAFDTTLLALLLSIPLMMFMISLEKTEEAYLINLDESWFHDIKPLLVTRYGNENVQNISLSSSTPVVLDGESKLVASEIKLLSTQIKALQETMEDLYETVFTSKLNDKEK